MLGYTLQPWADLRAEWGRERSGQLAQNFVALRLVFKSEYRVLTSDKNTP
jgi:hypothetical protein